MKSSQSKYINYKELKASLKYVEKKVKLYVN
jgi:hypothetical protein